MIRLQKIFLLIIASTVLLITACKKDSFITSKDAYLRASEDTLHFDTVFTVLGSTTQYLKIFNGNDQKLKLNSIELMGGANSFFKLNVDGLPGTKFTNIDLEANDSLYMFASVKIDPTIANLPFLVRDSIKIEYNSNIKWIQLEAFGKNAKFMRDAVISTNTTLNNSLPVVILGSLTVNPNATLTIAPSTQLYIHANAPIIINGTLKATADANTKIVFQGIRIDDPYKDYPGSWPFIYFGKTSKDNLLRHCVIKNAYQGLVLDSVSLNANPKVTIEQCTIDNIYDRAILCSNSSLSATNCLISNVGYGFYALSGGDYKLDFCTFASYSNYYLSHKQPLITLSNTNEDKSYSNNLTFNMTNSIIYGEGGFVDDEVVLPKTNATYSSSVNFKNVLYKQKTNPANVSFINCIKNKNPLFDSIDISRKFYSFKLKEGSPCIDSANNTFNVLKDINDKPRIAGIAADLGCYEKQ